MEINCPESVKFIERMENIDNDDFVELVAAPELNPDISPILDYLELEAMNGLTNELLLENHIDALERAELHSIRADVFYRQAELFERKLIERGIDPNSES